MRYSRYSRQRWSTPCTASTLGTAGTAHTRNSRYARYNWSSRITDSSSCCRGIILLDRLYFIHQGTQHLFTWFWRYTPSRVNWKQEAKKFSWLLKLSSRVLLLVGNNNLINTVRVSRRFLFTFALVSASRWLAEIGGEMEAEFKFQRRTLWH